MTEYRDGWTTRIVGGGIEVFDAEGRKRLEWGVDRAKVQGMSLAELDRYVDDNLKLLFGEVDRLIETADA